MSLTAATFLGKLRALEDALRPIRPFEVGLVGIRRLSATSCPHWAPRPSLGCLWGSPTAQLCSLTGCTDLFLGKAPLHPT